MKTKVIFERTGKNMEAIREEVIVNGEITKDGFAVMMAATNGDGTFVPAVVGLHEVNAADEAVYAKLVGIESCEANLIATCSADVLVGRFVNANGAWDELPVKGQAQSGTVRVGIPFVYGLYNFTPVRNGVNKKISWWISRQGIGHALYCFTSNYTAEIGYQFQHISSYISMFEAQFGTIDDLIMKLEGEILRVTHFCFDPRIREAFKEMGYERIAEVYESRGIDIEDTGMLEKVKSVFCTYVFLLNQQDKTLGIDLPVVPSVGSYSIRFNECIQDSIVFKDEAAAKAFAKANGLEKPFISFYKMTAYWQPLEEGDAV